MVVPSQRNACEAASPVVSAEPVTWPASLMAKATLVVPPSVPRSCVVVPSHRNACQAASPVV